MNIEKDEVAIGAAVVGWLAMIFTGGRAYEKISSRVEALERQPPSVPVSQCLERRDGCGRENKIQFDQGEKQFLEIKKLIADNDKAGNERHGEIMRMLLEMNKQ